MGKSKVNKNKCVFFLNDGLFDMLMCIEYSKSLSAMVCFLNLFVLLRN